MLATRTHTRATCLWLALRDGTIVGITDHDKDLTVDMTDISDVPVVYKADTGILPSDVETATGLTASNYEVEGPLSDLIPRADVLGHRFNRARARLFQVDWTQDFPDQIPILQGLVADAFVRGSRFVFEVRSDAERLNQTVGRVITPYCDASFGDERCQAVVPQVASEIIAVTSSHELTVDLAGVYADDHFVAGKIDFTSGALLGVDPVEIWSYVGSSGLVTTLVPLPAEPEVGDLVIVKRGCTKLKSSQDASLPTCLSYDNVLNFRGMDQVGGSDQYLRIPVPGEGASS
jgi:uncharacterized phage protein (TIGR02218 family)